MKFGTVLSFNISRPFLCILYTNIAATFSRTFFKLRYFLKLGRFEKFLRNFEKQLPVGIYIFKVNNRNTKTRCEICSKLTVKTSEQRQRHFGVFIVNSEHISHLVVVFLSVNFEEVTPYK